MAKKKAKRPPAKKAAKEVASKPEYKPAASDPVQVTHSTPAPTPEPPKKEAAPKKKSDTETANEDWEAMANVFDSAVQALGQPQGEWSELEQAHIDTNTRYAARCRKQIKQARQQ